MWRPYLCLRVYTCIPTYMGHLWDTGEFGMSKDYDSALLKKWVAERMRAEIEKVGGPVADLPAAKDAVSLQAMRDVLNLVDTIIAARDVLDVAGMESPGQLLEIFDMRMLLSTKSSLEREIRELENNPSSPREAEQLKASAEQRARRDLLGFPKPRLPK